MTKPPYTPPSAETVADYYKWKAAMAAKYALVAADNRREDERQAAQHAVEEDWRTNDRDWEGITATIDGGISERGSPRWREVMDEESGPDVDESDETTEES